MAGFHCWAVCSSCLTRSNARCASARAGASRANASANSASAWERISRTSARFLSPWFKSFFACSSCSFANCRCSEAGGTFSAPISRAARIAASDAASRSELIGELAHATEIANTHPPIAFLSIARSWLVRSRSQGSRDAARTRLRGRYAPLVSPSRLRPPQPPADGGYTWAVPFRLGAGEASGLGSTCSPFGLHAARRLLAAHRPGPDPLPSRPTTGGVEHEGRLMYERPSVLAGIIEIARCAIWLWPATTMAPLPRMAPSIPRRSRRWNERVRSEADPCDGSRVGRSGSDLSRGRTVRSGGGRERGNHSRPGYRDDKATRRASTTALHSNAARPRRYSAFGRTCDRRYATAKRDGGAAADPRSRPRASGDLQQGCGDGAAVINQQRLGCDRSLRGAGSFPSQLRWSRRCRERPCLPQRLRILSGGGQCAASNQGAR